MGKKLAIAELQFVSTLLAQTCQVELVQEKDGKRLKRDLRETLPPPQGN